MGWLDELKAESAVGAERRAAARSQLGTRRLVDFEARVAESRRAPAPYFNRVGDKADRQTPPANSDHMTGQCWRCGVRSDHGCAHQEGNG